MPRAARIVFSSMPYHIISRGNTEAEGILKDMFVRTEIRKSKR